ncbi:Heterokaryon incompatibility protein [Paramyrothecium foliicola]|nr:Heterokaryon incompatibility protein [Paramyrothecium foliicola]
MSDTESMSFLSYEHIRGHDEIRTLALFGGTEQQPIRVHLLHQTLSTPKSPWIALSYAWGPMVPSYVIFCNDNPFEVSKSLYEALLHLRKLEVGNSPDDFKCYWIDAICINQRDDVEKERQIPLMSRIYQAANKVNIWLGPRSLDSGLAITALREWAATATASMGDARNMRHARWRVAFEELSRKDVMFESKVKAVAALGNRAWFTRAWCFQEIVFASGQSTFVCGTDLISVENLMMAVEALIAAGYGFRLFGNNPNVESLVRWRSVYRDQRYADTRTWNLSHLLEQTEHQHATKPLDKIYSLLALISSTSPQAHGFVQERCPIRYDPPVSLVYENFGRLILWQDWDLRLLTQCYRGQNRQSMDLPSWVPDWRIRNHLQPLHKLEDSTGLATRKLHESMKEPFHSSHDMRTALRCLHVKGWAYGRIQEVHDIHAFLPELNSEGFGPGDLKWVRELHNSLGIGPKTKSRHLNFDSVVEFMYVLSGGNLPGLWHKLSWAHSRSLFPAHFRFEWTNQRWLQGDGTIWNAWRKGLRTDEGWHDKPKEKNKGQSSEERTSAYILHVYEEMLNAHKSLLRKAWQWDNDMDEKFNVRFRGTRQEYYKDPGVRAEMAGEVLRFIRQTMRRRVFFILENGTMGIGPATSRVGDVVYDLHRGYCPFVLRSASRPEGFINSLDPGTAQHFTDSHSRGAREFRLVGDAHLQPEEKQSSLPEGRRYYLGSLDSDHVFMRGRPEIPAGGFKKMPFHVTDWLKYGSHAAEDLVLI